MSKIEQGLKEAETATILLHPVETIWKEMMNLPPRQWIYGKHYIRKYITSTVAPGGGGKSSLALTEAVAMAAGRPLLGKSVRQKYRVWYWNGEDPRDEVERRLNAICRKYQVTLEELSGYLLIASGREEKSRITIAEEGERGGFVLNSPTLTKLKATIKEWKIDVVILDPLVRTHGIQENDNQRMNAVVEKYAEIADELNCSIELVHHVRKPSGDGEYTVLDGRGAVAVHAATRSMRVLNFMSKEEALDNSGVRPEMRGYYFRVDNGKSNLAPPPDKASWYRMVGVSLENAADGLPNDDVGVVTVFDWPEPKGDYSDEAIFEVQRTIAAGDYRYDQRSPKWVGKLVASQLKISLTSGDDDEKRLAKSKVRAVIERWIELRYLRVVERLDERGRLKDYVMVERWANGEGVPF